MQSGKDKQRLARGAEGRRDLASLLACLLAFYSVILPAAPLLGRDYVEICASPSADGTPNPDAPAHGTICLLCMPGCSGVPSDPPTQINIPSVFGRASDDHPTRAISNPAPIDAATRQRGPPTSL